VKENLSITVTNFLGAGSFGIVWRGWHRDTKSDKVEYMALKQQDSRAWKAARKERNILCHLNSAHVVKVVCAFKTFSFSYIATELCRGI